MNNIQLFMCDIKNTQNIYDQIGIKTLFWYRAKVYVMWHEASMMVAHCTQHEQNPLNHLQTQIL